MTSPQEHAMFAHIDNRQLDGPQTAVGETTRPQGDSYSEYGAWISLEGSEPATLAAAPVLLDAGLPPVLAVLHAGWVPTLNWTVQFKRHPSPGPMRCRFKTTTVVGGFLEEDGELFDHQGNLVAVSRQLAMVGVQQRRRDRAKL